jgi:hypothetical protein
LLPTKLSPSWTAVPWGRGLDWTGR